MTVTITDLPEELLVRILAHPDEGRQTHDLCAWALTSKQFNRLATPLLFEDVRFEWNNGVSMTDEMMAVFRLMLESPRHAQLVKSLEVSQLSEDAEMPALAGLEQVVHDKFSKTMPTEELRERWEARLLESDEPEPFRLTFFIMLCLSNLQMLCFIGSFPIAEQCWEPLLELICTFESSSGGPTFWSKAHEVFIKDDGGRCPGSTEPLAVFSRLPWLKTLTGLALGDGEGGDARPGRPDPAYIDLPIRTSNLENLALTYKCKIKDENLSKLLQVPKALKCFEYEVGHAKAWCECTVRGIQRALDIQSETLEEIRVTENDFLALFDPMYGVRSMSFSQFSSLRSLTIADFWIFSCPNEYRLAQILPPSIEELKLVLRRNGESSKPINAALLELLDQHKEKFAKLSRLGVHVPRKLVATILLNMCEGFERARSLGIRGAALTQQDSTYNRDVAFSVSPQAHSEELDEFVIDL